MAKWNPRWVGIFVLGGLALATALVTMTVLDLRGQYSFLNVTWQLKVANVFNAFFVDVQERTPSAPRSLTLTAVYGI